MSRVSPARTKCAISFRDSVPATEFDLAKHTCIRQARNSHVSGLKRSLTYHLRDASSAITARDKQLADAMNLIYLRASRRFDAAARLLAPAELRSRAAAQRARLEALIQARTTAMQSKIDNARRQFGASATALDAMSPLRVLERGYAIAQTGDGTIVREAAAVSAGDELRVRLWKGALDCRVESTEENV